MKYLSLFILLFAEMAQSQNLTLKGRVVEANGSKLVGATIILFKKGDSLLFKATRTDSSGEFRFNHLSEYSYDIMVSCIGFQSTKVQNLELRDHKEMPPIILSPLAQNLMELNISAKKPLIQILPDKTVFNIQGSLNSTGLSAFEILRKAPGILIDNQNNLIVEGKTGVRIFLDGKESILSGDNLINYLKSHLGSNLSLLSTDNQ